MRPPRLSPLHRIYTPLRPFRPPNTHSKSPYLRLFSQNSLLLLVTPATPRPQLPFLAASAHRNLLRQRAGQWQLSRLLTTERKRYIKEQLWLAGKYTVFGYGALILIFLMSFGVQNEYLERKYPTPREWTMVSRMNYRSARRSEEPSATETGVTDYARSGNLYRIIIGRLENPDKDGQGISELDEGGILVDGIGKTGADISNKSEPWRRCYYKVVMGAARAAEHLDGWVIDNTRHVSFPKDVVIGPDNPNPKPVPPGAHAPPLQENCSPAYKPPEAYYLKILTTRGFSAKQRVLAALAYADWLDFKGLPDSAEEMYKWGIDIAVSTHPDAINDIDKSTGIISRQPMHLSENLLLATTSLAVHHARNRNLSGALPIFLSVLRARRSLPEAPPAPARPTGTQGAGESTSIPTLIFNFFQSIFVERPYPPPPASGEDLPFRSPAEICEEAGVMAYIGEVLFASSEHAAGLSWTRDAVDLAEATFQEVADTEGDERCRECLEVGLKNWQTMVLQMAKGEGAVGEEKAENQGWSAWFASNRGGKGGESRVNWENERDLVEGRYRRVRKMLDAKNPAGSTSGWFL
ncbi:hypothetical protein FGG08_001923 [Glutinoglossum americanum]|uniref:MFS maltose permease n=1 Tax=Glutinoglossum americanum TaxID=1670608 RepID=A0A9P8I777_9PEZI|nr:hypothetical protein FGG08_001923 [Glutinoglossum americanum]